MRKIKARIFHFMLLLKQPHFCILFCAMCFPSRLTMSTNGPFMSGIFFCDVKSTWQKSNMPEGVLIIPLWDVTCTNDGFGQQLRDI